MKKHQNLLWTLLGSAVIAAFVALVYQSKQPAPLELDLADSPKTAEHTLVGDILADTEAFAAAEDTSLGESKLARPTIADSTQALLATDETRSQRAPDLDVSALSVSAQRIYLSGASLREDAFIDPSSTENLSVVRTLIDKRLVSVD